MDSFEQHLLRPVWYEVDLDALRDNFQETRRVVGDDIKIICALKCDAYGFGCLEVAKELVSMGVYGLAVADLFEAVNLRISGIEVPILVYASHLPTSAEQIIKYSLIPTITEVESALSYSNLAKSPVQIFVKVDVGLHRIGVLAENAISVIEGLLNLKNIEIGGIYTHLHFSQDYEYVNWQFNKFKAVLAGLDAKNIDIPIRMAAATPSILQFPDMHLNAVDPGRLIYGNQLISNPRRKIRLRSLFRSLKAKIIERKQIEPCEEFINRVPFSVHKNMIIGVIPIGWGDGYSKKHSSVGSVLVRGRKVPILDGISFEHTRINLTDVAEARVGDEVVLIGKQMGEEITLQEVVNLRGSDLDEVCQSVRRQVPRLYIKHGKPYKLETTLGDTYL